MFALARQSALYALPILFAAAAQGGLVETNLVGVDYDTGALYSISTSDASLSLIGDTGVTHLGSLDFFDGFLYGVTSGASPLLHRIGLDATVAETLPLGVPFTIEGGLAIAPDGTAYLVNAGFATDPQVLRFDLETGNILGTLALPGPLDLNGLVWQSSQRGVDGKLLAIDGLSNTLIEIDLGTGAIDVLNSLPPPIGSVGGMVLPDGSNTGYYATAAITAGDPGTNELYWFDTDGNRGAVGLFHPAVRGATPVGAEGISGLAVVPEPASVSLLALGTLALLRRRHG